MNKLELTTEIKAGERWYFVIFYQSVGYIECLLATQDAEKAKTVFEAEKEVIKQLPPGFEYRKPVVLQSFTFPPVSPIENDLRIQELLS